LSPASEHRRCMTNSIHESGSKGTPEGRGTL